jgi:diguanylate cyclase (GGDEF)-like protein/PAS domain S-box-containing protein
MDAPPARPEPAAPAAGPWAAFRRAHLFDYNAAATRFWLLLVAAGGLSLGLSAVGLAQTAAGELWQILGWLLIVAVAAAFPIQIPRSKLSIATGDVVIYLLLPLYGMAAAVLAAALEGLVAASRSSARLTSRVGTPAAHAAGMCVGGAAFQIVQAQLAAADLPPPAAHLAALAAAALLHFVVSTAALTQVIYLKRGLRLSLGDWYANSSWVGTLHLISAVLAGMLSLNAQQFGRSAVAVGVFIIGLSLALLRAHFRQQIAEHDAQEARVTAAELEAQQNQKRFHSAFSQASIGLAIVSKQGQVLQANQALHTLLGHGDGGLLQRPFRSLLHAGDAGLLERHVAGVLARREDRFSIELRCLGAEQREIWVSLHCALFDDSGSDDNSGAGLIFQLHDITSRRRAEGELRHIAYHDPLTDLANRNCFQERLRVAVERTRLDRRESFAVMMLDLDRFKIVNDSLGHPAGDELLKEVARRLNACVRPNDLVARLGGDEFAILIEGSQHAADAVRLGERLLQALDKPANINGTELRPLASIGLTFSDMGYREPDEVLRDADLAMYQAKACGKGRLALFDASLHEQLGHQLQLEADLRRAIGEGQLSLAYQPLFELDPHRLNGFEALARWTHPVRGAISPAVFIALAEETGCIEALTVWAIEEAVRQHAQWWRETTAHGELVMHVNVSGTDLAKPHFVPHVRDVLQRHGLPPRLLVLEITESTLMEHREQALLALGELCALGVKVGIDDFGTGYSSLAYLSTLPFDCLKIDRSFVIGMDKSRQNLEIVRTVISLGRSLNKQVVAEGIETHEQLVRLRQLGATIGQGYLLSRPLGPLQVQQLLLEPAVAPA